MDQIGQEFGAYQRVTLDDDGRITEELCCGHCGYTLKAALIDEVCSECGTKVTHSAHDGLLRYQNADRLLLIQTGLRILVALPFALIGLVLLAILATPAFGDAAAIPPFLVLIAFGIGIFLTTLKVNPAQTQGRRLALYARVFSLTLILGILTFALGVRPSTPNGVERILALLIGVVGSCFPLTWVFGLKYLGYLSRALPMFTFARKLSWIAWSYVFVAVWVLIYHTYSAILFDLRQGPESDLYTSGLFIAIQSILAIIYGFSMLWLFASSTTAVILFLRRFRRLALLPAHSKLRRS